jgi:hypothetical protein
MYKTVSVILLFMSETRNEKLLNVIRVPLAFRLAYFRLGSCITAK